jgi:hypothetical protein
MAADWELFAFCVMSLRNGIFAAAHSWQRLTQHVLDLVISAGQASYRGMAL